MSSGLSYLSGTNCRGVVVSSVAVLISSGLIVVGINCPVLTVAVLSVAVLNVIEPSGSSRPTTHTESIDT